MIFSRTKRTFEVKWKTFFFVLQVLSFRLKKQTSKNVADTTFKLNENKKWSGHSYEKGYVQKTMLSYLISFIFVGVKWYLSKEELLP